MKNLIVLVALFCATFTCVNAQNPEDLVSKKTTALNRKYLRPSLTKIYISDGTSEANSAIRSLQTVVDEKFDYNNDIKNNVFVMSSIPTDKKERATKVNEYLQELIASENLPNQVMHQWFPVDAEGNLSFEKIVERGNYAATDNDIKKMNASKRGSADLNSLGEQLIDRSYIVAYVVMNAVSNNDKKSKSVNIIPYVYKMDFNEEVMNDFYSNHYTAAGIDEMTFPTKFVTNANSGILSSKPEEAAGDYDNVMTLLRKLSDFQVKSPITYTHPIRANIGKKEGVSCDKRYAVMRLVEKDGEQKAQRVATVRATSKIMDNRGLADGQVKEDQQTVFYEIKGRKVTPGETLVENTDFGLNIVPEYTISEASLAFEYRLGKHLNVPGLFVYLKAAMPWSKGLGGIKVRAFNEDGEEKNFQVIDASIGFAKEFNFAGTFALTASVEGGMLFAPNAKGGTPKITPTGVNLDPSKDLDLKSYKVGASLKFGYYLTRNIQIYANAGYNYFIKSDEMVVLQEIWAATESKRGKFQKFQPLSLGAGLKIGF